MQRERERGEGVLGLKMFGDGRSDGGESLGRYSRIQIFRPFGLGRFLSFISEHDDLRVR